MKARGAWRPFILPDRQLDILRLLVSKAGQVVSKDALIDAAWKDVAVGDNRLEQAISALRRTLGAAPRLRTMKVSRCCRKEPDVKSVKA